MRIWFQNRRRKSKNENKVLEKALENEIQERVRQLSAQNPNGGFGSLTSLTMINYMNKYQNSFSEVSSTQQVRINYGFPSPTQSYNGGFMDRPRTLCSQWPLQHFWYIFLSPWVELREFFFLFSDLGRVANKQHRRKVLLSCFHKCKEDPRRILRTYSNVRTTLKKNYK